MLTCTPAGLDNAPITKASLILVAAVPILLSTAYSKYHADLSYYPHIATWHQYYRLFVNPLVYTSQTSVVVALFLLYQLRIIERMLGSRLTLIYILWALALSAVAMPLFSATYSLFISNESPLAISPGPTAVISCLLSLYHAIVPETYRFRLSGVGIFSDKVFNYIVFLQLLDSPTAIIKAVLGWSMASMVLSKLVPAF